MFWPQRPPASVSPFAELSRPLFSGLLPCMALRAACCGVAEGGGHVLAGHKATKRWAVLRAGQQCSGHRVVCRGQPINAASPGAVFAQSSTLASPTNVRDCQQLQKEKKMIK